MQKAEIVLSALGQKTKKNHNYVFDRVYRHFFNPDFYALSYQKLLAAAHPALKTAKALSLPNVEKIIAKMKSETFWPEKSLDGSKKETISECALVKEILSLILKEVYSLSTEAAPEGKIHQILAGLKTKCPNSKWAMAGRVRGFLVNGAEDYRILARIIGKKIADGRFIELLRRLLKTGHIKCEVNNQSMIHKREIGAYSLETVLSEIYLKEIDFFINSQLCGGEKSVMYFRYQDHAALFFAQDKPAAEFFLEKTFRYIETNLSLKLNGEIVNLETSKLRFLDYEIAKNKNTSCLPAQSLRLLLPSDIISKRLRPFRKNNRPALCSERINLAVSEILAIYNKEINELYNYYILADDLGKKLAKFRFYHYYSLVKTIAGKEKTSVRKVMKKYGVKRENGIIARKTIGLKTCNEHLTYFNI